MTLLETFEASIDSLTYSKWNVRRNIETEEEFQTIKNSIAENGLLYPLTVARMKNTKKLVIVAGRRRYKALQELGFKKVPVLVKFDDVEESQLRKITLIENIHRKDLADIEKGFGIKAVFEAEGYTEIDAIEGVKALDNWFNKNTDGKVKWKEFFSKKSLPTKDSRGQHTKTKMYDEGFAEICRSIGWTPKYQYQLLQIVVQLPKEILSLAQDEGLNTEKKLLLTHTKLRNHPEIQKSLIPELRDTLTKNAPFVVDQMVQDLETGYFEKGQTGYYYSGKERDKISKRPKTEQTEIGYLKVMGATHAFLRMLTGTQLPKGHSGKWTKEMIESTNEHRYKIVKALNGDFRSIASLYDTLELAAKGLKHLLELFDSEMDVAEKKEKLNSR